jgi:hypothetical protein
MARSPAEVLDDHLRLRASGDLETDLARNYAQDVALLCSDGTFHGLDAMRTSARRLREQLPHAHFDYINTQLDGNVGFLEWRAMSDHYQVTDGADSYVFNEDGLIRVQTIHYTLSEPW